MEAAAIDWLDDFGATEAPSIGLALRSAHRSYLEAGEDRCGCIVQGNPCSGSAALVFCVVKMGREEDDLDPGESVMVGLACPKCFDTVRANVIGQIHAIPYATASTQNGKDE